MHVSAIMKKNIRPLKSNAFVIEAAQIMRDSNITILPIEAQEGIVGTLTPHDITTRLLANSGDPHTTRVYEIMTADFLYCDESQDIKDALKKMLEKKVHRLLVRNKQENIVGVITLMDLVHSLHDKETR